MYDARCKRTTGATFVCCVFKKVFSGFVTVLQNSIYIHKKGCYSSSKIKGNLVKTFLVGLISLIVSVSPTVLNAKINSELQEHLARVIYSDCMNKDLVLRNDCDDRTKKSTIPATLDQIRAYILELNKVPAYFVLAPRAEFGAGCHGRAMLTCGEHVLDVSGNDFVWDGVVVSLPPKNINMAINNTGNLIQGSAGAKIQGGNRIHGNRNQIAESLKGDAQVENKVSTTIYIQKIESLEDQVDKLSRKNMWLQVVLSVLGALVSAGIVFLFVTPNASIKKRVLYSVLMLIGVIGIAVVIIFVV
jgi:hypothetical protein